MQFLAQNYWDNFIKVCNSDKILKEKDLNFDFLSSSVIPINTEFGKLIDDLYLS